MTPKEQGVLATLLTHQEVLKLQQLYPSLEACCEATGYDLASLRQRSIRLNVRWKQESNNPIR